MALRICCFEDEAFSNFFPLTYVRPVYALRPGAVSLVRRIEQYFPAASISLVARDQIGALLSEQQPDYPVGMIKRDGDNDVLFLNGRVRNYGDLPGLVKESRLSTVFKHANEIVAVLFKIDTTKAIAPIATHQEYLQEYKNHRKDIPEFETSATLYHFLWDMIADIESMITSDIEFLKRSFKATSRPKVHEGAHLVCPASILLDNDVEVCAGAVIDASKGPVYIGASSRVESHAAIYGPTFVGANSVVLAGKVSQCSIGPTCRIGGEVEESIFHSYVNKYHAGFIGHSVVGSWVNFGAMTTNSDLKNNYSSIRVSVNGRMVDSDSIKVGSFIGDHTKFGIGTLLNTGITIGACCNIFGAELTSDKEIKSFSWGNTGKFQPYAVEKAIETARRTAERRNVSLSEHEEVLLKDLAEGKNDLAGVVRF